MPGPGLGTRISVCSRGWPGLGWRQGQSGRERRIFIIQFNGKVSGCHLTSKARVLSLVVWCCSVEFREDVMWTSCLISLNIIQTDLSRHRVMQDNSEQCLIVLIWSRHQLTGDISTIKTLDLYFIQRPVSGPIPGCAGEIVLPYTAGPLRQKMRKDLNNLNIKYLQFCAGRDWSGGEARALWSHDRILVNI